MNATGSFGSGLSPTLGKSTEGGEALQSAATSGGNLGIEDRLEECPEPAGVHWYALWTRSHCERLVYDQLYAKGLNPFLPAIYVWSRRAGVRRRIQTPMFPGYLFMQHAMDKESYIEVRKSRGLVCLLGERWDRLAVVPDREIRAIQAVCQSGLPVRPHTFLREGQRVRIVRGPFLDVEGILVRQQLNTGLLVLSVELLQRSVAVEVDCTCVVPA